MRSWSLVRLNTSLERSVEPPLASMCSLDKEKVFPRNAETSTSRETTRSPARRFAARSWSLALRARWSSHTDAHLFLFWLPTVPAVSSERRLTLLVSCPSGACLNRSLLRAMSRQVPAATAAPFLCSAGQRYAYAVGVSPVTRLVFASVTSSFGNTKGKLFTKFKESNGELLFDLLHAAGQYRQRMRSQHLFRSRFAPSLTPARWPARQSISECSAANTADKLRTNDTHYCFIDIDYNTRSRPICFVT